MELEESEKAGNIESEMDIRNQQPLRSFLLLRNHCLEGIILMHYLAMATVDQVSKIRLNVSSSNNEEATQEEAPLSSQVARSDAPKKAAVTSARTERLTRGRFTAPALAPARSTKVKVKETPVPKPTIEQLRRSNRKIQPTLRLLEGLQSQLTIYKFPLASRDKSQKNKPKATLLRSSPKMEKLLLELESWNRKKKLRHFIFRGEKIEDLSSQTHAPEQLKAHNLSNVTSKPKPSTAALDDEVVDDDPVEQKGHQSGDENKQRVTRGHAVKALKVADSDSVTVVMDLTN